MDELNRDDKRRVKNCDYYIKTKQVMKNAVVYDKLSVGEVYFIRYTDTNKYVTSDWSGQSPSKFMVFHKDEGFVFIKRIIASGKLGKEVSCLTTSYYVNEYYLESDPDYVNSILLQDENSYDPLAASKKIASNKGKVRRKNKKLELAFNKPEEAYAYIQTLSVGDLLYNATTTYGTGVVAWEVKSVCVRDVDQTPQIDWRGNKDTNGNSSDDQAHNRHGFVDFVSIDIEATSVIPSQNSWATATKKTLIFNDFLAKWHRYYHSAPFTLDDA